jgi:hypothetical protein
MMNFTKLISKTSLLDDKFDLVYVKTLLFSVLLKIQHESFPKNFLQENLILKFLEILSNYCIFGKALAFRKIIFK